MNFVFKKSVRLFIAIVLEATMIICMTVVPTAAGVGIESGDESGLCGDNVIYNLDSEGTLTISGTGAMYDYDYYHRNNYNIVDNTPWYSLRDNIKSIIIKEGVTSVGDWAFYNCRSLKNVDLPLSVTNIGDYAFFYCSNLASVDIPVGVTNIGTYAFSSCISLTDIEIPAGVTTIEEGTFSNCMLLTNINLPEKVKSIGDDAFSLCNITSIELPSSITSIGNWAFSECKKLTDITIPSGVTNISQGTFNNCYSLNSVNMPENLETIGESAFSWCINLESITIPLSVTSIGELAFNNCSSLKVVNMQEGIESIGREAFANCEKLAGVIIPQSVISIGYSPFHGCGNLESIAVNKNNPVYDSRDNCNALIETETNKLISGCNNTIIPSSVTSIESNAFMGCNGITYIEIPSGVTSIGANTFFECSSLKTIVIPSSVTEISEYAFYNCNKLAYIYYEGSKFDWSNINIETGNDSIIPDMITYNDVFHDISGCSTGVKTAIRWASVQGIVTKNLDGTFAPYDFCTRQQMVIMLWRLAGKPEPESIDSALKFIDTQNLSSGSKKAIAWAVENGIVSGFKDGTFDPTGYVTRQQTVVMLWRLAGKPEATTTSTFTDTTSCSAGVMKAINWAASVGITRGYSNGDGTYSFATEDNCQRQHIATFVYRYAKLMK